MMDTVAKIGTQSGTRMRQKIFQIDAPSTTAASSSSPGSAAMKPVIMRMAKLRLPAIWGKMTDQ